MAITERTGGNLTERLVNVQLQMMRAVGGISYNIFHI